ncbi:SSI family serine proteinase inhibitor [Streptomyces nodosus]|uniref:SSI family serine proteinase inhibitor n=1 Tax=Streptomyces nodosus TaxID=40318 RepID=UPI0036E1809C
MTKTTLALRGALLAAAVLTLSAPAPAIARPADVGNWLYLTLSKGDALTRDVRGTLLMCDPPQGHPRAARACAELAAAQGDVDRIPPEQTICPMIYAPVSVSARGEWNGRHVEYEHTFANACDLTARTGAVFALSEEQEQEQAQEQDQDQDGARAQEQGTDMAMPGPQDLRH